MSVGPTIAVLQHGSSVVDLSAVRRRDRLGRLVHEYEIGA